MGGKTGDKRVAVLIRFREIPLNISGRQTDHTAEHGHGGSKMGTVAFPGIQKEMGHKIIIGGLGLHIQRVPAVTGQPGLKRKRLLIGRSFYGRYFHSDRVDRFLQMVRKNSVGIHNITLGTVFQRGTNLNQGTETRIAGLEKRR